MPTFECPHCGSLLIEQQNLIRNRFYEKGLSGAPEHQTAFTISTYFCPNCKMATISFKGISPYFDGFETCIFPKSLAKKFPDYIPESIRTDYEEAYAIVHLSPKASATLSRRCLQGMIRDFYGIRKSNLNEEINAIRDKLTEQSWQVLNSIRQLGNIGAHMEKDVNLIIDISAEDAEKLLKVIEHFIKEWYIIRHDTQVLFDSVVETNNIKQDKRRK